jgi:hypothetical protein
MRTALLLCTLLTCVALPTRAAPHCVSNVSELKSALATIQANDRGGSSVDLRLQSGTYVLPAPASGSHGLTLAVSMLSSSYRISGGWNAGCSSQSKHENRATVLDGQALRGVLTLARYAVPSSYAAPAQPPQVRFDTLRFANGVAELSGHAMTGCLGFEEAQGTPSQWLRHSYELLVDGAMFSGCRKAMEIGRASAMTVRNSLFIENYGNPAAINGLHPNGTIYLVNNTFRRNEVIAGGNLGGEVWISGGAAPLPAKYVINNIFAQSVLSGSRSYQLVGDGVTFVRRNRVQYVGADTAFGTPWILNSTVLDPMFAGVNDHRLGAASPLRDFGENSATGGVGTLDFGGALRIQGGIVDLGAYELMPAPVVSGPIFGNGFEG